MDYEDTKIEKKGNICCFIFAGTILYCIVSFIINYFLGKSNTSELFFEIVMLVPFLAICIGIPYVNIKNSKRNREVARIIKERGIRVNGTIKKIRITYKTDYKNSLFKRASFFRTKRISHLGGVHSSDDYYDYAIVEYVYKGEIKIVNTPYLNFYKDDLKNKDVDVFVYGDKVYVDNFKIKREEIQRRYKNWNNMNIKVVLSFILMFILIGLSIYLTIIDIIPKSYISFIIVGLMIIYLISVGIIYIRYLDDVFNKEDNDTSIKNW